MKTDKLVDTASNVLSLGMLTGALSMTTRFLNQSVQNIPKTRKRTTQKKHTFSMTDNYWTSGSSIFEEKKKRR